MSISASGLEIAEIPSDVPRATLHCRSFANPSYVKLVFAIILVNVTSPKFGSLYLQIFDQCMSKAGFSVFQDSWISNEQNTANPCLDFISKPKTGPWI